MSSWFTCCTRLTATSMKSCFLSPPLPYFIALVMKLVSTWVTVDWVNDEEQRTNSSDCVASLFVKRG